MRAPSPALLAPLLLLLSLPTVAGQSVLAAWSYDAVPVANVPTYAQLMLPDVGWTSPTTPVMITVGSTSGTLTAGSASSYYSGSSCACESDNTFCPLLLSLNPCSDPYSNPPNFRCSHERNPLLHVRLEH